MSKEEMQFADPEWQPPGQMSSTLDQGKFHPKPVNTPREEQQASLGSQQGESEDESNYFTGYKASKQQHYASHPPMHRKHRRARRWFWFILILILLTFLAGRPILLEGGYLVEGFALENLIFGLAILTLIIAVIAIFRGRR